jgi:hypothetical protein
MQSPLNRSSKDKFIMIIELPYILRKRKNEDPALNIDFLQLSVYGTVVPDIMVPESDVRFEGQNLHLSTYTRPNYPALSVNFVVDNEYKNYYLLWKWLDVMNNALQSNYGGSSNTSNIQQEIGDQFEYQTNIVILALNEYNKPVMQFNYTKGFISRLGGIQYSYRDGSLLEGSADFHFSQLSITNKPTVT